MPTIEGYFACCSALKRFWRRQRSSCWPRSMSRKAWIGLEMTVMSTPPIFAASSAFSIVVGGLPVRAAPILRWKPVAVNAGMSSGGRTWTWKSMIIDVCLAFAPNAAARAGRGRHCADAAIARIANGRNAFAAHSLMRSSQGRAKADHRARYDVDGQMAGSLRLAAVTRSRHGYARAEHFGGAAMVPALPRCFRRRIGLMVRPVAPASSRRPPLFRSVHS